MRQRETKAERFVRVAEQRTQRAVDATIRFLIVQAACVTITRRNR